MTKRIFSLLIVFLLLVSTLTVSAKEYTASDDGTYTIEITGKTPNKDYTVLIIAGDYTDKEMPEISEANIIYINQVTADSNGTVTFTDFIPMTDSVGTIYIGGDDVPFEEGVLMTASGFGYVEGKLLSYSGTETIVEIPEEITSIEAGVFGEETERVIFSGEFSDIEIRAMAFANGTKLILSPLADKVKDYAKANGYAYSVIGDYNGNETTDIGDYKDVITHFAKQGSANTGDDFDIIMDFDSDGKISLNDAAILLNYLFSGFTKGFSVPK